MRLLVLGGTGFVGRAVVAEAMTRGSDVTTFNRGRRPAARATRHLTGDRLRPADLAQLERSRWDCVVDTWSGAPSAARDSAALLADRAGRYAYVSSESVYRHPPPLGSDESAATVDSSADLEDGDYSELKRGAELAVEAAFGDRAVLARAATILGPHEDVGRLPWWLLRMDRGGEVLAPGPRERPLQYVDARDLASWLLDVSASEPSGVFNVACRRGHATMGELVDSCRRVTGGAADPVWVRAEHVEASGIEPWSELPIWLPPGHEYEWMHDMDVERAHAAGLHCRPLEETVRDTWDWLLSIDRRPPLRDDVSPPGVSEPKERAALAAWLTP